MPNHLKEIRIVLLNTYHPGNIGSTMRAMKTMGLSELVLVNPHRFPDPEATSLAAGAADLLENVKVCQSFEQAIADRTQVFATSARQAHTFSRSQNTAEQAAHWIKKHQDEKIAIVFGGERDGLSTEEISLCQQILFIPGNPEYSVLNVSSAVQIVCYELFKALAENTNPTQPATDEPRATQQALKSYFDSTEKLLVERGYLRENQPSDSIKKFKTLINRIEPTAQEINLLRGIHKALTRQPIDEE